MKLIFLIAFWLEPRHPHLDAPISTTSKAKARNFLQSLPSGLFHSEWQLYTSFDHIRHLRNCLFPSLPYSVLWIHVCSSQHVAGTIPHFLCPGYRVQTLRWTSQTWALPWCKTCHTSLCPRPSIPRDFLSVLPRYAASCLHIICPHMVCLESSSVCPEEVSHMKFYKDNIIYWQNMDYI